VESAALRICDHRVLIVSVALFMYVPVHPPLPSFHHHNHSGPYKLPQIQCHISHLRSVLNFTIDSPALSTKMTLTDSIHVENGYQKDAYTYYPVLIIGAGETGLAMGCRLKQKLGFDQFRIFDRQSGIGGPQ